MSRFVHQLFFQRPRIPRVSGCTSYMPPRIPSISYIVSRAASTRSHFTRPFLGLEHLKPKSKTEPMGDSVEDEARHIDKKPRLDSPTQRSPDTPFGLRRSPDAPFGLRGAPSGSKSSGASLLGALSSVIHSAKVDKKKTRYKNKSAVEPYSKEDIVRREVISLLGQEAVDKAVEEGTDWKAPFQQQEEVELVVSCLSAHGMSVQTLCTELRTRSSRDVYPSNRHSQAIRCQLPPHLIPHGS